MPDNPNHGIKKAQGKCPICGKEYTHIVETRTSFKLFETFFHLDLEPPYCIKTTDLENPEPTAREEVDERFTRWMSERDELEKEQRRRDQGVIDEINERNPWNKR